MEKLQRIQGKSNNWPTVDFPRAGKGEVQKLHGWFSQKYIDMSLAPFGKKKSHVATIYLNENGEEIKITEVSTTARPSMRFDDIEYKGVMVKYKRTIYH